jgi:hypothetical protein
MTSILTIAVASLFKGVGLLALIGGGVLAGTVALLAGLAVVAVILVLGLLAGTAGLALGLLVLALVLGVLLLPLAVPALLLYLLLRPRRPAGAH